MARIYTLRRRAERQVETRQRIVQAAVDLHSSVGPVATTLTMIAERAGVQRNTLYAHFPDERSLFLACSAQAFERDPFPQAAPLRQIEGRQARLRAGLGALYAWYERNASLAACVLRDAAVHEITREMIGLRLAPPMQALHAVLNDGLASEQTAMLAVALDFHTWQTLTATAGCSSATAAGLMVRAIDTAGPGPA